MLDILRKEKSSIFIIKVIYVQEEGAGQEDRRREEEEETVQIDNLQRNGGHIDPKCLGLQLSLVPHFGWDLFEEKESERER